MPRIHRLAIRDKVEHLQELSFPRVVLVQMTGLPFDIPEVQFRDVDEEDRREIVRPGKRIIERTNMVCVGRAVGHIQDAGIRFREAHWRYQRGSGTKKIYTLVFASQYDAPAYSAPPPCWERILGYGAFGTLTAVYANPRGNGDGPEYRMDVIQVTALLPNKAARSHLAYNGGTYHLEEA